MLHPFQHITDLSEICYRNGVQYVVISPGSRNAPLVNAFYDRFRDRCYSIVDERSAGYFALGIARYLQSPVVLICTSGTAALNYGPALAEAYYSQVPLLAITADRPAEWIDQQDNQTIRQKEVYRNFIKRSYNLPEKIINTRLLKALHNQFYEALNCTTEEPKGPVHLNVPLFEPLYTDLPRSTKPIELPYPERNDKKLNIPLELDDLWKHSQKVLIVHGQDHAHSKVSELLKSLSEQPGVIVIAENISNIQSDSVISHTDILFAHTSFTLFESPDLILYSGGQVVSRRLKNYLRNLKDITTWRIGIDAYPMDTFKKNNSTVSQSAEFVYEQLSKTKRPKSKQSDVFQKNWMGASINSLKRRDNNIRYLPFSDVYAMQLIMKVLPEDTILELGNSSVIRSFQFFNCPRGTEIFSNRGVSGIDGSLSTATGTATVSHKMTIAVMGDLSFIYDSNALWNRRLPSNLRIIVLNNEGGGIFSLLEGPSSKPAYEDFFIAYHPVSIQKLAEAYNLDYFYTDNESDLKKKLSMFLNQDNKAGILEVKTRRENNVSAYQIILGKKAPSTSKSLT